MRKTLTTLVAGLVALAATSANAAMYSYTVGMNQAQETVVTTPNIFGAGIGLVNFDDLTGEFFWQIIYSNLTGPVTDANIHVGASGASGSIVIDLAIPDPSSPGSESDPLIVDFAPPPFDADIGGDPSLGFFVGEATLLPAAFPALTGGPVGSEVAWYINFRTDMNPMGEIRGQLFLTSAIPLPATAWLLVSALGGIALIRRRPA